MNFSMVQGSWFHGFHHAAILQRVGLFVFFPAGMATGGNRGLAHVSRWIEIIGCYVANSTPLLSFFLYHPSMLHIITSINEKGL